MQNYKVSTLRREMPWVEFHGWFEAVVVLVELVIAATNYLH